jgi:hypothetical protein
MPIISHQLSLLLFFVLFRGLIAQIRLRFPVHHYLFCGQYHSGYYPAFCLMESLTTFSSELTESGFTKDRISLLFSPLTKGFSCCFIRRFSRAV